MMVTSYHFNVSNFTWKPFMFLSCITFFLWTLQAAQSEDEEEGEKIYYKGKFYSLSSNQPEIKVARDTWEEIISSRYNHQGNEDGSLAVRFPVWQVSRQGIVAGCFGHYWLLETKDFSWVFDTLWSTWRKKENGIEIWVGPWKLQVSSVLCTYSITW